MRNIADCSAPRRAAGKSWVRGAVVAQLATNTLWMAPRAYRRKAAAADGSEEEEDTRWRNPGETPRAAELRHRVRELLSEAARAECSDDEFGDEDEDDEYGFDEDEDDWDDDDGQDEEDFNVDEHSAHDL